jgi:magnesium transporter
MRAFYADGETVRETRDVDELCRLHAAGTPFWLDLEERSERLEKLLVETFHLHPLVIEDIWCDRTLPKIEDFDDYLFILVHGVRTGSSAHQLELVEVDIVVGKTWVITHHRGAGSVAAVRDTLARSCRLLKKGPAFILHNVLDHLVDDYLPILDDFDGQLDDLDRDVLSKAGKKGGAQVMGRLLTLKRTLQSLRRISLHQRELLMRLSRGEFDEIPQSAMPFFRDVYDHFARVTDLADSYRELASNTVEAYLTMQSNRMNEIMKTLTLMSTVMLPLTFIAGVYGMNFEHMPELKWHFGYPFALGLMGATAAAIILWFRLRRWL